MNTKDEKADQIHLKKTFTWESLGLIVFLSLFFFGISSKMGFLNMINTFMNTSYELLLNTVFYITAIAVLMGAFAELLSEFGIVAIANRILSPLMKPLYDLPGASMIGIFNTYFSDNPAILPLAENKSFKSYFKKYQFYGLTNLGTSFGMGLIISTFIMNIKSPNGESFVPAVIVGNIAAIIGSIVSTRLMLRHTKKIFGTEEGFEDTEREYDMDQYREVRDGSYFSRFLNSIIEGGKKGVGMGVAIIPGVLIICSVVQILTFGPSVDGIYTGAANEGVEFLPYLGSKIEFILKPLFGFRHGAALSVPITALGAAGAAIALIPGLVETGMADAGNLAVFTAMCMCWSGYLSTHVAMMDSLGKKELAGKAIFSHTVGGLVAGVSANIIYGILF